ncbi:MAG: glutamyl-tRNA reductase, partial [Firmicutes bacterium]|nr:glutamyl-tRNA reductase [Bacillota bacterium]
RTEIYAAVENLKEGRFDLAGFISREKSLTEEDLAAHFYVFQGREAVEHLFRVACGLDSLVVGETQILGQVKEAYLAAAKSQAVGKTLHNLFNQALRVGKRAHSETSISDNAVSVSYAAVELAKKIFDNLEGRKVLIVGAGKMGELTARHLVSSGASEILVANRTAEKAASLARLFQGRAVPWPEIPQALETVDVVISSTGAPGYVLEKPVLARAMQGRRNRSLFLIDIAVPRDVDPAVGQLENVFLYDMDDLKNVVDANLQQRVREGRKVERIIKEEVEKFEAWRETQEVVPLINSLRGKMEEIRRQELEKALRKLSRLSDSEREVVVAMTMAIINKVLNEPITSIKEHAGREDRDVYLETLKQLFKLQVEEGTVTVQRLP